MFETVVIATDGSKSAQRCVHTALGFADRFDAPVHALYVEEVSGDVEDDVDNATESEAALSFVRAAAPPDERVETAIRQGNPATEIMEYAESVDADVVAVGTRGRHGEHAFLLGSVAEEVVRDAPMPVLTVRQLEASER